MTNPNLAHHKGFEVEVLPNTVSISLPTYPANRLVFTPGHGDKLKALVGAAMRMEDFPALPEFISDEPFFVFFSENGSLKVRNEDSQIIIEFHDCDGFIESVDVAIAKVRDERTLRPGKRGTGGFVGSPEPVIDGR